jgi:hypothetical protein
MDLDGNVREECARWLEMELWPLARGAARILSGTPAQVMDSLRSREDVRALEAVKGGADKTDAERFCDELEVVTAAVMIAHWAGDSPGREVGEAIQLLALVDAYEYAQAATLVADLPEGSEDPALLARYQAAYDIYDGWKALGVPVRHAVFELLNGLGAELRQQKRGD